MRYLRSYAICWWRRKLKISGKIKYNITGICTIRPSSQKSVADPGFPRRGGRQPPRWGCQPTILPNFYRKLHENERIWTPRGGRASLAPPLRSANENSRQKTQKYWKFFIKKKRYIILNTQHFLLRFFNLFLICYSRNSSLCSLLFPLQGLNGAACCHLQWLLLIHSHHHIHPKIDQPFKNYIQTKEIHQTA